MSEDRRSAACLAVGSELLGDEKLDRNSLTITRALAGCGIAVDEKRVVGDDVERIAEAVRDLIARHDLVVVTGGSARPPTTSPAMASPEPSIGRSDPAKKSSAGFVIGTPLGGAKCRSTPRRWPGSSKEAGRCSTTAAPLPECSSICAAGCWRSCRVRRGRWTRCSSAISCPNSCCGIPASVRVRRTLVLGGVFESDVEESVRHLYDRFGRENVSILASYGVVRLVSERRRREGRRRPSSRCHGARLQRGSRRRPGRCRCVSGLAEVAISELRRRGQTLATAESCTGGLVSARLTDVPGASDAFVGGVVSYSNDVKEHQLGVPPAVLVDHGAVSEEVARAMASGVRPGSRPTGGSGSPGLPDRRGEPRTNRWGWFTGRWPGPEASGPSTGSSRVIARWFASGASTAPSIFCVAGWRETRRERRGHGARLCRARRCPTRSGR